MQSSTKRAKVLSALAVAAVAGLGAERAHAVTLTSYYADAIISSANPATTAITLGTNGTEVDISAASPTITVPVGDYISYGIAALVTNNVNPDGGTKTNTGAVGKTIAQPTNLGLADIGYKVLGVSANNLTGSLLLPVQNGANGTTTPVVEYNSTASLGGNGTAGTGPGGNLASTFQPNSGTFSLSNPGDVEAASGTVGLTFQIFQGNPSADGKTTADQMLLTEYTAQGAGAAGNPHNATLEFDTLAYQALGAGTVTLLPAADPTATQYWSLTTAGTASTVSAYSATYFSSADTVTALPVLTIVISGGVVTTTPVTGHAIFALAATAGANYPGNLGHLIVQGSNGKYQSAAISGFNVATGNAEASGFNPATDEEIYGLEVLVNGTAATKTQLDTLVTESGKNGGLPSGVTIADTAPANDPFSSIYNLFLTAVSPATGTGDNFLGFDLSNGNDSALTGYTVAAIAVVPEPMSIGMLALGGIGLLARRRNAR